MANRRRNPNSNRLNRARHRGASSSSRYRLSSLPTRTRTTHLEIILLTFLTVAAVGLFLFAVYVSVRHRRLAGSSRRRGGLKIGEGKGGRRISSLLGDTSRDGNGEKGALLGGCGGHYNGFENGQCGGENGEKRADSVSGKAREVRDRVVGMLQALGQVAGQSRKMRSVPLLPRRDVEVGVPAGSGAYGNGYRGEGWMGGQVDGNGCGYGHDMGSARRYSNGAGTCLLRRRGPARMSSESECPV